MSKEWFWKSRQPKIWNSSGSQQSIPKGTQWQCHNLHQTRKQSSSSRETQFFWASRPLGNPFPQFSAVGNTTLKNELNTRYWMSMAYKFSWNRLRAQWQSLTWRKGSVRDKSMQTFDNAGQVERVQPGEGERKEGEQQDVQGRIASSKCREGRREAEQGHGIWIK